MRLAPLLLGFLLVALWPEPCQARRRTRRRAVRWAEGPAALDLAKRALASCPRTHATNKALPDLDELVERGGFVRLSARQLDGALEVRRRVSRAGMDSAITTFFWRVEAGCSAAGLTYVASAFQTVLTLIYVISRARQ